MKTFLELLEYKKEINQKVDFYDSHLKSYQNKNGLVPDVIRLTKTFKIYKIGFDIWFKKLQDINVLINRNFKTENRDYQIKQRFLNFKN